ncbi:MAG: cyclopropane-fatty-acyl-phospholipid synthase family protein [Abditibacteriaceae bacterium]
MLETLTRKSTFENAKKLTLHVLDELIPHSLTRDVGIRLWDGTRWPDENPRRTTVTLNHPGSMRAMFLGANEVALGEAYLKNDFDIDGIAEDVFPLADTISLLQTSQWQKVHALWELMHLPPRENGHTNSNGHMNGQGHHKAQLHGKPHSVERDKAAVAFHYNVSNDFFSLWLDKRMVYSCAYFKDDSTTLDDAQERKLEHICRKLNLQRGESLLDIGCGWGGMIMYAAKNYGVHATGITLSEEQLNYARERICEAGLENQCKVELRDYREIEGHEQYDKLVSIGMVEHVGKSMLPTYFSQAHSLLKPGGTFLSHGIGCIDDGTTSASSTFVDKHVFPDGELAAINEMLRAAEGARFEVRDVENLREHYARTLRMWVQRLEKNHEKALQMVDEKTFRVWRIYMSGSAYGFRSGSLDLYQSLLCKNLTGGKSNMPLTRDKWYA